MKKKIIFLFLIALMIGIAGYFQLRGYKKNDSFLVDNLLVASNIEKMTGIGDSEQSEKYREPISNYSGRINKKPFGIYIDRDNSPVQPERFSGYHTGADFEANPDEINLEITIKSLAPGRIILKQWVSGYGGVVVELVTIKNKQYTVIYGHLNLASINKKSGDELATGETLGILGNDKSNDTDGERKHLHLGIHKGSEIDLRGYVNKKEDLSAWIDPQSVLGTDF